MIGRQSGSANLDILSMRINTELNIAFSDKTEVERLVSDFPSGLRPLQADDGKDTESATAPLRRSSRTNCRQCLRDAGCDGSRTPSDHPRFL